VKANRDQHCFTKKTSRHARGRHFPVSLLSPKPASGLGSTVTSSSGVWGSASAESGLPVFWWKSGYWWWQRIQFWVSAWL